MIERYAKMLDGIVKSFRFVKPITNSQIENLKKGKTKIKNDDNQTSTSKMNEYINIAYKISKELKDRGYDKLEMGCILSISTKLMEIEPSDFKEASEKFKFPEFD